MSCGEDSWVCLGVARNLEAEGEFGEDAKLQRVILPSGAGQALNSAKPKQFLL